MQLTTGYRKLLLTFFLMSRMLVAQEAPPLSSVPEISTLHVSTQLVLLDASVQNRKNGARISGLTLADFALTEDSSPETITYLSEDRLPLSLVFLFDVTDSVQPVLKSLAAGSRALLTHLGAQDEVAIMTFSDQAVLLQDFTTDHALLDSAIARAAKIHSHRQTFLFQSLLDATLQSLHSGMPNSRPVQVWLTDGTTQDHTRENPLRLKNGQPSPVTEAEAREAVLRSHVVVAGLIDQSWLLDLMAPRMVLSGSLGRIADFADLTGGPITKTGKREVADRFADLIDTLRQRYTLGFRPTHPQPPGTLCHLKLTLSPAFYAHHITLHPEDVLIRTRQSYYR